MIHIVLYNNLDRSLPKCHTIKYVFLFIIKTITKINAPATDFSIGRSSDMEM